MHGRSGGNCPFGLLSDGPKAELLLQATGIQSFAIQTNGRICVSTSLLVPTIPPWEQILNYSALMESDR